MSDNAILNTIMHADINTYNQSLSTTDQTMCDHLARTIDQHLIGADSKIWHGHPVWFLDGNPIVGFSKLKGNVRLLFWSGQSFDEDGLKPEGSFKAAEARYEKVEDIDEQALVRWLHKAKEIQWDYKNIVKRKGELLKLTTF